MTPFDELAGANGHLDRPVNQAKIELSKVEIFGSDLVWPKHRNSGYYSPKPGLLERFAKLGTRPDIEILKFARAHGVLGICKHGLPSTHRMQQPWGIAQITDERDLGCYPETLPTEALPALAEVTKASVLYKEPLRVWRRIANEALAILRIAERLHQNKSADDDDWKTLRLDRFGEATKHHQRQVIAKTINNWVVVGNVRLAFDWRTKPSVVYTSSFGSRHSTLFGVLALQILLVASGSQGLATCSSCQGAFVPKRKPSPGRRSYCDECRATGAPQRDAKRAWINRRSH